MKVLVSFKNQSERGRERVRESIRRNEYGKTGHSKICFSVLLLNTFLRHFVIILKHNCFRASTLYHITDTDNM